MIFISRDLLKVRKPRIREDSQGYTAKADKAKICLKLRDAVTWALPPKNYFPRILLAVREVGVS